MFTGIVRGCYPVVAIDEQQHLTRFSVGLAEDLVADIEIGASVAVDGVCLTVVSVKDTVVSFDVVEETLKRSTLRDLYVDRCVNIERSVRFGAEVGGHILSGHVLGTAKIATVEQADDTRVMAFECPAGWMKYILTKGFIALDGVSLTVVDVCRSGCFTVAFIPETLRITTFGRKKENDFVNLEIDPHTQAIVETVERILAKHPKEETVNGEW